MNYFDYFNPNCSGYFLADLLKKKESQIQTLKPLQGTDFVGLEVTHPQLHGPIRFWLDPRHGYMPVVIERYARTNDGKFGLLYKSEVATFIELAGVWTPEKAKLIAYIPGGPAEGRAYSAFSIEVDRERSSLNSIASTELFKSESLPAVNNVEFGWKKHLPVVLLEAAERQEKLRQKIRGSLTNTSRLLFIGINLAIILLLVAYVMRKRLRHRGDGAGAV